MRVVHFLLGTLICFSFAVPALEEKTSKVAEPLTALNNGSDGGTIAYTLVRTFLTEEQWQSEVKKLRGHFEDWERDNHNGSIGQYLDDRLIVCALSAAGGKIEKVQKGMMWLAYYKEFNQQSPAVVTNFLREHRGSMSRVFDQFNWDKASAYIRNKEWRSDFLTETATPVSSRQAVKSEVEVAGKVEAVVSPGNVELSDPERYINPDLYVNPDEVTIPENAASTVANP